MVTLLFDTTSLDNFIGIKGSAGYLMIILTMIIGYTIIHSISSTTRHNKDEPTTNGQKVTTDDEDEKPDPPRNFTTKQLRYFDGTVDEKTSLGKPVYLSLNGIVFDVSSGRNFYGPGGPYEIFAGRECGAALAKMSFNTEHLDCVHACKTLNHGERMELENWIEKFTHYKSYPIMGRLIPTEDLPEPGRLIPRQDLKLYKGDGIVPEGFATAPIYVGAGGKVYDMSFGGVTFYGKDCPYNIFAGCDASRALAKMSLDIKDVENSDTSDLTEKEIQVLNDWMKTFEERKGYPVVGILQ